MRGTEAWSINGVSAKYIGIYIRGTHLIPFTYRKAFRIGFREGMFWHLEGIRNFGMDHASRIEQMKLSIELQVIRLFQRKRTMKCYNTMCLRIKSISSLIPHPCELAVPEKPSDFRTSWPVCKALISNFSHMLCFAILRFTYQSRLVGLVPLWDVSI